MLRVNKCELTAVIQGRVQARFDFWNPKGHSVTECLQNLPDLVSEMEVILFSPLYQKLQMSVEEYLFPCPLAYRVQYLSLFVWLHP